MSGSGDGITRKISPKNPGPPRTGKGNNAPKGGAMRAMTGRGPTGAAKTNMGSKKGKSYGSDDC